MRKICCLRFKCLSDRFLVVKLLLQLKRKSAQQSINLQKFFIIFFLASLSETKSYNNLTRLLRLKHLCISFFQVELGQVRLPNSCGVSWTMYIILFQYNIEYQSRDILFVLSLYIVNGCFYILHFCKFDFIISLEVV